MLIGSLAATGLIPLALAFWANRRTSLAHALVWALIAWTSWTIAMFLGPADSNELQLSRYVALCLTGCAGIAVFGARRPHVATWDFVVLSLLAVMLLPVVEAQIIGTGATEGLRVVFLTATTVIGVVNYLPTRFACAAILVFASCVLEVAGNRFGNPIPRGFADALLISVPWVGWLSARLLGRATSEIDQFWLSFRDRWGAVWALRAREQFNLAALNAGWPVRLGWGGLIADNDLDSKASQKYLTTMRAILQRFLAPD